MENYTDTTIIECNRMASSEGLGGNNENNSLFTNELGNTLQLEVGDQISVFGAYVSQVGAGSETIEIKGDPIVDYRGKPVQHTYQYTEVTKSWATTEATDPDLMGGYMVYKNELKTGTYDLADNKAKMILNFYNNSNGEGYFFLPRRWVSDTSGGYNDPWDVMYNWTYPDMASVGRVAGNGGWPVARMFLSSDYQFYRNQTSFHEEPPWVDSQNEDGYFIPKNDNSRFTQMKREGVTYLTNVITQRDATTPPVPIIANYQDPAVDEYNVFRHVVDVEVTKGFNTPSDVSTQITNTLKKGDKLNPYMFRDNTGVYQEISSTYETNTWKPTRCASYEYFGKDGWDAWYHGDSLNDEQFKYYACYQDIYVKRPDLWETGRKLNDFTGFNVINAIAYADRATESIEVDVEYNEANLQKFLDLFKVQERYPEIWDNYNFRAYMASPDGSNITYTKDNCRFLHINPQADAVYVAKTYVGRIQLGDDMYDGAVTLQSRPVFFKYDKNYEGIFNDGEDLERLSMGFATKSANNKVVLHPELIGGMYKNLFRNWNTDTTSWEHSGIDANTRRIGWDYHFNAYTTLVMMAWTGRLKIPALADTEWAVQNASQTIAIEGGADAFTGISAQVDQTYIGANDPLFNFDAASDRFYFSRLHTAENAGQVADQAGGTWTGATPINNGAGQEVWKMNKRMKYNQFTPAIVPMRASVNASIGHDTLPKNQNYMPKGTDYIYQLANPQMEAFCVFDAHGGVFIEDLGYDEDNWDKSLWYLLGFSWEQFNTTTADRNRNVRITDDNKDDLKYLTTNCEVVAPESKTMNVNPWGAVEYTTQVPCSYILHGPNYTEGGSGDDASYYYTDGGVAQDSVQFYPPITQVTESIKVLATDLPRKMLQPYFTIRSNLAERGQMIGSKTSVSQLPIMAVCDKQYTGGDFIFFNNNPLSYRVTKPTTFSSITTSIHDPDGSFSRTNEDNCVIYKVVKNMRVRTNLYQDYLEMIEEEQKSA